MATCVGFPDRSLDLPQHTRPSVLLSISMYEGLEHMNLLLQNALNFTESTTMLMVHFDASSDYPSKEDNDANFEWIWNHPRITVNCDRVDSSWWSGEILHSHTSNMHFALQRRIQPKFIVFQASNMLWVRRGMEAWVHRERTSVPRITTPEACTRMRQVFEANNGDLGMGSCVDLYETSLAASAMVPCPCFVPPFPGVRFLIQQQHEGTFYPFADLLPLLRLGRLGSKGDDEKLTIAIRKDLCETYLKQRPIELQEVKDHFHHLHRDYGIELTPPTLASLAHIESLDETYTARWPMEELTMQTWIAMSNRTEGGGSTSAFSGHTMCAVDLSNELTGKPDDLSDALLHDLHSSTGSCESTRAFFDKRPHLFAVKLKHIRNHDEKGWTARQEIQNAGRCLGLR